MIDGLIGRPGSGKSYQLTEKAIEQADRGRQVFANYPINHPNCWTFRPVDLLDLPPGVIVIDEAHLWFPARMALKLPPSWLAMLSQTRKNGWDMYWAAQHEARVDRVLRDVSNWMWLCSSWWQWNGHPLYFESKQFEPEKFRKAKAHISRRIRFFNRNIAQAYDTYARVEVAEHATSKDDPYSKESRDQLGRIKVTSAAGRGAGQAGR
jgi:hypothetical protein